MEMKSVRVLRKFYIKGEIQDVGKVISVSPVEATTYVSSNKAEIVPEEPPAPIVEKKPEPEEQKEADTEMEEPEKETTNKGRRVTPRSAKE